MRTFARKDRGVAIAAAIYFFVAAAVATQFGTWTDEEYTLTTTAQGPAFAFSHALTYELQAPLYFVLEALWRELDPTSVYWARLPSLLCTVGLFFSFALIGRRLAPDRNALWFTLIATLNPFVVFAGFEIRLYALGLLLASVMWLLFDSGFASGDDRRARAGFIVLTIAAIYVQYFLAFALAGFGCVLIVRWKRRAFVPFALASMPIVLAALPLALFAHDQVGGYETRAPHLAALLAHNALHPWLDFLFPFDATWAVRAAVHRSYLVLVVLALVVMAAARPRLRRSDVAWIACTGAIEIIYLALVAAVRLTLNERHYVGLYVPLAAAAYAVACAILRGRAPRLVAVFGFGAALTVAALVQEYRALALPGDWRRVGEYLASRVPATDAIVVFTADGIRPLQRQYHGPAPIVAFPVRPPANEYDADVFVVHSQAQAAAAFAALHAHRRLWFVSIVPCYDFDQSYGCVYIAPAIERAFTVLNRREFYGSSVTELQRSTAAVAGKKRRSRSATNAGTSERRGIKMLATGTLPSRENNPTFTTNAKM